MKRLVAVLMLLTLTGCASHISYVPGGPLEASDYTINETLDANGRVISRVYTPFHADRWYSDALDKLGPMMSQLTPFFKMLQEAMIKPVVVPTPTPAPKPEPVPVPTPTPAPAPEPTPAPAPIVPPVASKVFSRTGNVLTLDMNTLPASMRKAGFAGRDNALYYAMSNIYRNPDIALPIKPGDGELARLEGQRKQIYDWFDTEVMKVWATLAAEPATTLIAITNDAYDRLGCRLGPAIVSKLEQFGSRVRLGEVLPEP